MTMERRVAESAIIALVAEFIGTVTGTRPPSEREVFPKYHQPALARLVDGLLQVSKEMTAFDKSQCDYPDCRQWRSEPCGEGCHWEPARAAIRLAEGTEP